MSADPASACDSSFDTPRAIALREACRDGDHRAVARALDAPCTQEEVVACLAAIAASPEAAMLPAMLERSLTLHPDVIALRFAYGVRLCDEARFGEAAQILQYVVEQSPDALPARFWLGSALLALGKSDQSLRMRTRALAELERDGLLSRIASLPAAYREQIDAAIAATFRGRADAVQPVLQAVRERHGAGSFRRIHEALQHYLGTRPIVAGHPLQQPSFLFVPGLPSRPWREREEFPFLAALEAQTDVIRDELLALLAQESAFVPYVDMDEHAPAAPTWQALNRSTRWSAFHFFRHGERVEANRRRCPRTAAALDAMPLHRVPGHGPEALFSLLRPHTRIPPHSGVINGRLTVHLPLVVPADCGALRVGGQARSWHEGRCLVFDDSFVHEAWNDSDLPRAVLIFDLWDPALSVPEREALSAAIVALGEFNRRHGVDDPMVERDP